MKRIIALMLCALMLCAAALSEGTGDFIRIAIDGRTVQLAFDNTEGYSSVVDGVAQASFYAYADGSSDLYELYMLFPEGVQPGTTIDQDYATRNAPECSLALIVTVQQSETFYFAGQLDGGAYPEGSSYGVRYEGALTATLTGMDVDSGATLNKVTLTDCPFQFTMPASNRRDTGENPFEPAPTDPAPEATPAPYEPYAPRDGYDALPTPGSWPEPTPRQTYKV